MTFDNNDSWTWWWLNESFNHLHHAISENQQSLKKKKLKFSFPKDFYETSIFGSKALHVKIRNWEFCRIKRICMLATVLTFENTFDILTFENTFDTTADSTLYPRRRLDTGTVLRWLTPWPKSQDIFDHEHDMFFVQKLFPRNKKFYNPWPRPQSPHPMDILFSLSGIYFKF